MRHKVRSRHLRGAHHAQAGSCCARPATETWSTPTAAVLSVCANVPVRGYHAAGRLARPRPVWWYLQESSAPLYERTRLFRIYEHTALPGLFHTAEYSTEIMRYWVRFLGLPDDAEAATAARLARQKVLRSGRRRWWWLRLSCGSVFGSVCMAGQAGPSVAWVKRGLNGGGQVILRCVR
jgi:hypothetical protein